MVRAVECCVKVHVGQVLLAHFLCHILNHPVERLHLQLRAVHCAGGRTFPESSARGPAASGAHTCE